MSFGRANFTAFSQQQKQPFVRTGHAGGKYDRNGWIHQAEGASPGQEIDYGQPDGRTLNPRNPDTAGSQGTRHRFPLGGKDSSAPNGTLPYEEEDQQDDGGNKTGWTAKYVTEGQRPPGHLGPNPDRAGMAHMSDDGTSPKQRNIPGQLSKAQQRLGWTTALDQSCSMGHHTPGANGLCMGCGIPVGKGSKMTEDTPGNVKTEEYGSPTKGGPDGPVAIAPKGPGKKLTEDTPADVYAEEYGKPTLGGPDGPHDEEPGVHEPMAGQGERHSR